MFVYAATVVCHNLQEHQKGQRFQVYILTFYVSHDASVTSKTRFDPELFRIDCLEWNNIL